MRILKKTLLNGLFAFMLGFVSVTHASVASAYSDMGYGNLNGEPTSGEMLADAAMVRPGMMFVTLVTTGVFVVTLPFTLLGGNVGEAGETLVVDPAKYTFVRPLGRF